jgi:hypothetical protein
MVLDQLKEKTDSNSTFKERTRVIMVSTSLKRECSIPPPYFFPAFKRALFHSPLSKVFADISILFSYGILD